MFPWGWEAKKDQGTELERDILPARNWGEILKNSVRQRTELVSAWTSQTLLTYVDHRIKKGNWSFSRELQKHGGNPGMQCRRFGISKRDNATLFSLFSFWDVCLACLNSKDFPLFALSQAIIHATISSLWRVSQTLFYWSWLCSSWLANFTLY